LIFIPSAIKAHPTKKLYKKLTGEVATLTKHPDIGRKTDNQLIRGLVVENFILFYEVYPKMIVIHTVWDSRQDPGSLKIK
jgi:plasmid stabilization system protein ParE